MITVTLYTDDDPRAPKWDDAGTLLYEAEWNEGASQREHVDALLHFAAKHGPEAVEAAEKALDADDPSIGFAWLTTSEEVKP